MTIRKQTMAERIADIKVEMSNRKDALSRIAREAEKLKAIEEAGFATAKEQKRAGELAEIAHDHLVWISEHTKILAEYYKPAMVIDS